MSLAKGPDEAKAQRDKPSARPALTSWRTLSELLAERAQAHPDRAFISFDRSTSDVNLTYGDTWKLACRWANLFQSLSVPAGRPALLALPNGVDFVGAFFGASLAGLVPSPSIPRRLTPLPAFRAFLSERADWIGAGVIVTTTEPEHPEVAQKIPLVTPASLPVTERECMPCTKQDSAALLQFTSATEGRSKAVLLTHQALLYQASTTARILEVDPLNDLGVSWLPLFHDMGLLGFLLTPAAAGAKVFLLRTEAFMANPYIWLNAISREKATITSAPPSAYVLAARFAKKAVQKSVDLGSLRVVLLGAERITPHALEVIKDGLGPRGLRWSSIVPAYGMAEIGLLATMSPLNRGPHWEMMNSACSQQKGEPAPAGIDSGGVVGCGFPVDSTMVKIVDENGSLADRHVGQIMLKSPSMMMGHLTKFGLDTSCLRDGWLATGDQGFLENGELFVVGRSGELLNVGGAKYMPEEFEEAAMLVKKVRGGRVLAIGQFNQGTGTESVTLLVEAASSDPEFKRTLAQAIRQAVSRRGLPLGQVLFVPPKTIERTPNGKLPRVLYRARLQRGDFPLG